MGRQTIPPEQRMYLRVKKEINSFNSHVNSLKELIRFYELKIQINQEFLDRIKKNESEVKNAKNTKKQGSAI